MNLLLKPLDADQSLPRALAWMLVSCVFFAAMQTQVRFASHHLHPFEILFWRNALGVLIQLPLVLHMGGLRGRAVRVHVKRATSGFVAACANYYAIAHAPLATANAITFAAPLLATLAAVLFMGERIHSRRITALVIGFIGVLIVVHPDHTPFTTGIAAALLASVSIAFSIVAIKHLTISERPELIVFYSFALMAVPTLLVALPFWQWPRVQDWPYLLGVGIFASIAQTALVLAFRLADTAAVLPFDFLRFGLIVLSGVIFFGEAVDSYTLVGGSIILAATVYLAHRERQVALAKRPCTPKT